MKITNKSALVFGSVIAIAVTCLIFAVSPASAATNCTANYERKCISNIAYWYDSCGAIQSIYQNCNTTGQVCQNGACVNKQPVQPPAPFVSHYRTQCYNNNIYWYSSHGTVQDVYKSCSDNNSCTVDTCTDLACNNALMCDGSTCVAGSPDYVTYCNSDQTTTGTINNQTGAPLKTVSIIVLGKKDTEGSAIWQKSVGVINSEKIDFLLVIKNTASASADNVLVTANLTGALTPDSNMQIDGVPSNGSIISGLTLGTLAEGASTIISFTATANSETVPTTFQVVSTVTAAGTSDADSMSVTVGAAQVKDNFAAQLGASGIMDFVKQWYLWGIVILILIILFIVIFRRLSTSA